ncbi:MAG: tRNA (uridine(34)/cytosine(34)/5-carboxymethylaminomethyluridine(34)-2'-O)-methyltransferase TrmL [Gammaproteobacteria bacterium]|nr:MAG: tRNA (uridine(34)/cytosine(34)/5-carboxymethylaminomethyluridine(34)-2'-O)-methyltransferase TrmL [Gammaproteobacteria bacterium]
MFHIILYQPEIPPNTGNIIRLCANTGARLHLIEPLGFIWDDKRLRRAGLDYDEFARVQRHVSLDVALETIGPTTVYAFTTKGSRHYHTAAFQPGDALLFGPETRGLPEDVLEKFAPEHRLRLPMQPHSRSLNLSNTVAVALYEAWRQCGFEGGA